MKISIVIPTLNEEGYISALLDSILSQTLMVDEILVVDCGSSDNTIVQIQKYFPHVHLLACPSPVARQRNMGGNQAQGEILIFLDADVTLEKDFIKSTIREFQDRKLDIACPKYIPFPGDKKINLFYNFFNHLFELVQNYKPSGAGSCIIVSKKLFEKAHGFDTKYKFDDLHFIRKASKNAKFAILSTSIFVSDRRIAKIGFMTTLLQYLFLSVLFVFDAYTLSNLVPYSFGIWQKKLKT